MFSSHSIHYLLTYYVIYLFIMLLYISAFSTGKKTPGGKDLSWRSTWHTVGTEWLTLTFLSPFQGGVGASWEPPHLHHRQLKAQDAETPLFAPTSHQCPSTRGG